MHFQALNEPVPRDCRLREQLSTGGLVQIQQILNTMVEPKSSWATRTLPSKTQWPRTRCDTCCRACGVCAYVWIHISLNWNSFWLTLAHKLISLLTSFHWLILKRVATASLSSTQWFWMISQMVSHFFLFFLTSQERIDRLVVRGNEKLPETTVHT